MSRGINKVILIGHLGQDPEKRATPGGATVTTLRIATSEQWKDKQTGERKEATEWHTVVLWNQLADIAAQYLTKGAQVYIEGKLRTRKWQDKNTGTDRYSTEIIGETLNMLGGGTGGGNRQQAGERPANTNTQQGTGGAADFDDDIPF